MIIWLVNNLEDVLMSILLSWVLVGFLCGIFIIYYENRVGGNDVTLGEILLCLVITGLFGWISIFFLAIVTSLPEKISKIFDKLFSVVIFKGKR